MTTAHTSVVIVGAGPTGLTAAALLADHGVPSVILERWDDVYPQPRAVHLDDEVYRVLGRLGLAEEFAAISRPGRGLRLVTSTLDLIAEFARDPDPGVHGYPAASMFDQPELERILRNAVARRSDLVTLRGGTEVGAITQGDTAVTVHATDRATGEPFTVEGAYLLGCDGAGSVTRSVVGTRWRDLGFSQRWLVIDIETTADLRQWDGVQQVCDMQRAATFMRIGDTRYRWEFQLREDESASDFADLDAVRPLMRPWLAHLVHPDLQLIRSAEYTFNARVAQRWRDRRIFLLGDAAHLTPPFIGQGMGAGVRDAANLSWKIAATLSGSVPSASLDSYEDERKPHAVGLIRLAMMTGALMTGGGRGGDRARRCVAPILARTPAVANRLTDSATPPLSRSYYVRGGARRLPAALRGATGTAAALPGTLAPNTPAYPDGGRLDGRPPGFVLISRVEPTAEHRFEISRRGATVLVDTAGGLADWLAAHHAVAAVVRPDGTVMAAGRSVREIYTQIPTVLPLQGRADTDRSPRSRNLNNASATDETEER